MDRNIRTDTTMFTRSKPDAAPAGAQKTPSEGTPCALVLAALEPLVAETARRALVTALDDVGGAAMRADLAGIHHETQYTRLFRS
jgi:urease accessory protein